MAASIGRIVAYAALDDGTQDRIGTFAVVLANDDGDTYTVLSPSVAARFEPAEGDE